MNYEEGKRGSVVVVFGDGRGVAGAENLCLFADPNEGLVEAVSVAVGAKEGFFQDNAAAPFADFVVGGMGEDLGGGACARIRVSHLSKTTG